MTTINSLKKRWFDNSLSKNSLKRIFKAIGNGEKVKSEFSPFGKLSNGFSDFRGIDFKKKDIINVIFENADLSHCNLDASWIKGCSFNNIIFEKTVFSNISDIGNTFKNTSFKNCNFKGSVIGYAGSTYKNCKFEESNFANTGFIRGKFDDSRIINCKLKNVDFYVSTFINCSFVGVLEDVWFRGEYPYPSDIKEFGKASKNEMKNVSFKDATLIGVNFSNNCDLSTIIMPNTGNYRLFKDWKRKLEFLKESIENWPEYLKKESNILVDSYLIHADKQNWFLLNIDEIENSFGLEISTSVFNVLY